MSYIWHYGGGPSNPTLPTDCTLLPTGVPSPVAWYDAACISGVADGGALNPWPDRMETYDATKQVSSSAPILRASSLNALPTIEFGGEATHCELTMSSALMSGATEGCYACVFQLANDPPIQTGDEGNNGGVIDGFTSDTTGSTRATLLPWSDGIFYEHFGATARMTMGDPTADFAASARIYNVHSASGDFKAFIDGTQFYSTASNTVGFGTKERNLGWSVGLTNTSKHYLEGNIAEVIIWDSNLDSTNRQKVEGYLAWKWGLQGNLPAGHPYKSAAPT